MVVELFVELTAERPSYLYRGKTIRTLDILTDNDLAWLVLAAAGAAYLAWLSVRALRGRLMSMLVRDQG